MYKQFQIIFEIHEKVYSAYVLYKKNKTSEVFIVTIFDKELPEKFPSRFNIVKENDELIPQVEFNKHHVEFMSLIIDAISHENLETIVEHHSVL